MNKIFWCVFIFVLFLNGLLRADEDREELFLAYEGPIAIDQKPVNPSIVLRQRLVTVRPDLVLCDSGGNLVMNLFDDVVKIATCTRMEELASGGFAWLGLTGGPETGEVTIVVKEGVMTGSVFFSGIKYLLRHFEDEVYVIREIEYPLISSRNFIDKAVPIFSEYEIADLVNLERESIGLHPLTWNNKLFASARGHSEDMALLDYFSHDSLNGLKFYERITAEGYIYNSCGENIAAGLFSPQAVMDQWMNSSGHRANILKNTFCDIGVGYAYGSASTYKHYWTQNFGRQNGVIDCPVFYTIIASAGLHGSITPSGAVTVPYKGTQIFHINPDTGYRISNVIVDGLSLGVVTQYTFTSVIQNHKIEAYFEAVDRKFIPWFPILY